MRNRANPASGRTGGRSGRKPSGGISIRWSGLTELDNDRADAAHRRFFKLETFAGAIEKMFQTQDSLFAPALHKLRIADPLASLGFRLVDETDADLRFLVTAITASRKRTVLVLFAAKNADEHSLRLRRRWKALGHAYERLPGSALRPLASGKLYLPDRHRRRELGREIFCFVTAPVEQAFELRLARGERLCTLEPGPKLLSGRDEATVRMQLMEMACRLYDPKLQVGLLLPDLARGQVMLQRETRAGFRLLVVAPDGLRTRLTVPRFVHELMTWSASGNGQHLRLCPETTEDVLKAMRAAVGNATTLDWLARYKRSVSQRKLASVSPVTPDELTRAGIE